MLGSGSGDDADISGSSRDIAVDAQEPDKIFHYVPHHLVLDYARLGWLPHDSLADTPHGRYAILMEWPCLCPIRKPARSPSSTTRAP
jgi:hypothetical protein